MPRETKHAPFGYFTGLVARPWFLPGYRVVNSLVLVLLGTYLGKVGLDEKVDLDGRAILLAFCYVVLFFILEVAFSKSVVELQAEAKRLALQEAEEEKGAAVRAKARAVLALEISDSATVFLSREIHRAASAIFQTLQSPDLGEYMNVNLESLIGEALRSMCRTLQFNAAEQTGEVRTEILFRSTYMCVREDEGQRSLHYYAWFTPDGHAPRSATENVTYDKGVGIAGLAWRYNRPQIEDEFVSGTGWVDNYDGQGREYESMICVPVSKDLRASTESTEDVVGVITIDTSVEGYFGSKGDRDSEQRSGNIVKPYAEFIAFAIAVSELESALREQGILPAPSAQ